MTPLSAPKVLEAYYHEARSKLLDIAAILDRFERGEQREFVEDDLRLTRLQEALHILANATHHDRAERLQQLFSLAYDAHWVKPEPRY